jgi:hypothetical protein
MERTWRAIPRFALLTTLLSAGCDSPPENVSGTLAHQVVSRAGGAEEAYVLATAAGEVELLFDHRPPLRTGDRLRVRGRRLAGGEPLGPRRLEQRFSVVDYEVLGQDVSVLAQPLILDPATTPPARNILVVLFNFKNDDRQHYPKEQIQQRVLTDPDSVRAFYQEQSYGLIQLAGKQNPKGDVTGWHTLDAYNIPCDTNRWSNMALEAARREGLDTTVYQHFIFYFPASPACDFGGLATIGGRFTWIAGASISTMAHEFGHSFGLLHSNSLECRDKNLARVTVSDDCANVEYGHPFDLMGRGGLRHTNAYNKAVAGWLRGSNILVGSSSGSYHIVAQERPSNDPQLLVVPRDTRTSYYLDFRQPFGFDNFASDGTVTTGVMLMLGNNLRGRDAPQSWLLDTTPTTTSVIDAPLGVGKTFRDPDGFLSITLTRIAPEGADIQVQILAPTPDGATGLGADGGARPPDDAGPPLPPEEDAAPARDGPVARPATGGCHCALGSRDGGGFISLLLVAALLLRRRLARAALIALAVAGLGCSSGGKPARDTAAPPPETDAGVDAPVDARAADGPRDAGPEARSVLTVPNAPADIVAACNQEADIVCPRLKQCDPQTFAELYNDDAFCRARTLTTCRLNLLDPARKMTALSYATCIADLRTLTCLDVYWGRRPASCSPPQGNLPVDSACAVTRECQPGLACRVSEGARCGRCVTAVPAGARCSVAPRECTVGTRCVRDECVVDLKLGEPCKRTVASCSLGLICTDAGCAERTGVKGTSCARADVCDPTKQLYCNLLTGLCDDLPAPAAKENENCADFVEMGYQPRCLPGLYCQLNAGTTGGRCRKYADLGGDCDDSRGPLCAPPALCFRRFCRVPEIVYGTTIPSITSACP